MVPGNMLPWCKRGLMHDWTSVLCSWVSGWLSRALCKPAPVTCVRITILLSCFFASHVFYTAHESRWSRWVAPPLSVTSQPKHQTIPRYHQTISLLCSTRSVAFSHPNITVFISLLSFILQIWPKSFSFLCSTTVHGRCTLSRMTDFVLPTNFRDFSVTTQLESQTLSRLLRIKPRSHRTRGVASWRVDTRQSDAKFGHYMHITWRASTRSVWRPVLTLGVYLDS